MTSMELYKNMKIYYLTCDLEEKVKLPESEVGLSLNKNTNC